MSGLTIWSSVKTAAEALDVDRLALDMVETAGILTADSFVVMEGGPQLLSTLDGGPLADRGRIGQGKS